MITKEPHGVDDGWWEGEHEGKIGNFPSLVVDECDENGEPLTEPDDEDDEDDDGNPPVHSPPTVPPSLLPSGDIVVTQPSPSVEHQPSASSSKSQADEKFEFDLSQVQQKQYKTQFQAPEGNFNITQRCFNLLNIFPFLLTFLMSEQLI